MEPALNLLQPLLKDIQDLLGSSVFLRSLPCLGQALLGEGGYARHRPLSWPVRPCPPRSPAHLGLRAESPESQLRLLQSIQGVPRHGKAGQLLLPRAREPLHHLVDSE